MLNDMLRASPGDQTLHQTPFIKNHDLLAYASNYQNGNFRIIHRDKQPFIYFMIQTNASILEHLFDKTTVKDDGSLKASLTENTRHWILNIQGQINKCPGTINTVFIN